MERFTPTKKRPRRQNITNLVCYKKLNQHHFSGVDLIFRYIIKKHTNIGALNMVRAERIELSSLAWKAGILAIIRRPQTIMYLLYQDYSYF